MRGCSGSFSGEVNLRTAMHERSPLKIESSLAPPLFPCLGYVDKIHATVRMVHHRSTSVSL